MVNVLLFDLDGVLLHSPKPFSQQYIEKFKVPSDPINRFFQTSFQECLVGRADLKQVLNVGEWQWRGTIEALLELWFEAENQLNIDLIEEVKRLNAVGEVISCIATNQEIHRTHHLIKNPQLRKNFHKFFSSAKIGHKKPEAEFYQHIYEQFPGVPKDKIILIDDSIENIEGARQFWVWRRTCK